MDKNKIFEQLLSELKATLSVLVGSALEAKDAATNEESKAENKYDTRGLEASYLAGAQAKRAEELMKNIAQLEKLELRDFKNAERPGITSLVQVQVGDGQDRFLFVLPFAGGTKVRWNNRDVQVISPESPVGRHLLSTKVGEGFDFSTGKTSLHYEILELF